MDEVIERVGPRYCSTTSHQGMLARHASATGYRRSVAGDPSVLLFDEPTNGLDLDGCWIRSLLRSLADEGRTVLVSSHLMSEMQRTADRLIVVGRGRLMADATIDEILEGVGQLRARVAPHRRRR